MKNTLKDMDLIHNAVGVSVTLMYGIIVSVCSAQFPYSDMYPEIAANLGGGARLDITQWPYWI